MNYLELTIWCRGKCFLICELNMGGKGMVELVVLKYTKVSIIISIAPGEYRSLATIATSRENKGYQSLDPGGE